MTLINIALFQGDKREAVGYGVFPLCETRLEVVGSGWDLELYPQEYESRIDR